MTEPMKSIHIAFSGEKANACQRPCKKHRQEYRGRGTERYTSARNPNRGWQFYGFPNTSRHTSDLAGVFQYALVQRE